MRARIQIPSPKANKGERIAVRNYRKRPAVWEEGVVTALRYEAMHGPEFNWSYDVFIQRENTGVRLYVDDDGIRQI